MADQMKTCANCGQTQSSGDFCEACGTRLPVPIGAPPASAAPPSGTPQGQYGTLHPTYAAPTREPSFWSKLFDLSFEEFVTPSIIKVLFVIAVVVIALGMLGAIIAGFVFLKALGILMLIAALIGGFIYLLLARVMLEMFVVFFRIRDDTEELVKSKR